jgi:hypothetical protein
MIVVEKTLVLFVTVEKMAGTTRLELATSAVTGQRSNQLNYVPTFIFIRLVETRFFIVFSCGPRFHLRQLFPSI